MAVAPTDLGAITLAHLPFLFSDRAKAAAAALHKSDLSEAQTLPLLQTLRRDFTAGEAGALLALARLRQRAATKFPLAEQLFFTAEALEQATAWAIAEHRADFFAQHVKSGPWLDLGCGIGGDTIALAQRQSVIAVEADLLRLRLAEANAAVLGLADRITFLHADWTALSARRELPAARAAFADPARRSGEQRIFSLHAIQPPLVELLRLQQQIPALGVKVMPGVKDEEVPANCGVEFVSHEGVCKEAVLWFGELAAYPRWASVHTDGGWDTMIASGAMPPLDKLEPGMVLHEPDPALIRAGALVELCVRLEAHLFDPQIAYLVSHQRRVDPLVQSFVIDEVAPFSLKQLNQRLQTLQIGTVELKKRGFPVEPESLRPRLKLYKGGRAGVVIFTRRGNERLMLIGRRIERRTATY